MVPLQELSFLFCSCGVAYIGWHYVSYVLGIAELVAVAVVSASVFFAYFNMCSL